jgi:predicted dehydrogenase
LPADNFRFDASLGGGALLDAGAYTLKAAQFFLGHSLEVKSASLSDTMGTGVDTLGAAHLVNADGVSALVGFGFDNFYQCNIELWGSQGKLTASRAFTAKPGFTPEIVIERQGEIERIEVESDYPFKRLLEKIHSDISDRNFASSWQEAKNQANLIGQVKEAAND